MHLPPHLQCNNHWIKCDIFLFNFYSFICAAAYASFLITHSIFLNILHYIASISPGIQRGRDGGTPGVLANALVTGSVVFVLKILFIFFSLYKMPSHPSVHYMDIESSTNVSSIYIETNLILVIS